MSRDAQGLAQGVVQPGTWDGDGAALDFVSQACKVFERPCSVPDFREGFAESFAVVRGFNNGQLLRFGVGCCCHFVEDASSLGRVHAFHSGFNAFLEANRTVYIVDRGFWNLRHHFTCCGVERIGRLSVLCSAPFSAIHICSSAMKLPNQDASKGHRWDAPLRNPSHRPKRRQNPHVLKRLSALHDHEGGDGPNNRSGHFNASAPTAHHRWSDRVGKSTAAVGVAQRAGFTRVMSTDAIREIMRATDSEHQHTSCTAHRFPEAAAVSRCWTGTRPAWRLRRAFLLRWSGPAVKALTCCLRAFTSFQAHEPFKAWEDAGGVALGVVMVVEERTHQNMLKSRDAHSYRRSDRYLHEFWSYPSHPEGLIERAKIANWPMVDPARVDNDVERIFTLLNRAIDAYHED